MEVVCTSRCQDYIAFHLFIDLPFFSVKSFGLYYWLQKRDNLKLFVIPLFKFVVAAICDPFIQINATRRA